MAELVCELIRELCPISSTHGESNYHLPTGCAFVECNRCFFSARCRFNANGFHWLFADCILKTLSNRASDCVDISHTCITPINVYDFYRTVHATGFSMLLTLVWTEYIKPAEFWKTGRWT